MLRFFGPRVPPRDSRFHFTFLLYKLRRRTVLADRSPPLPPCFESPPVPFARLDVSCACRGPSFLGPPCAPPPPPGTLVVLPDFFLFTIAPDVLEAAPPQADAYTRVRACVRVCVRVCVCASLRVSVGLSLCPRSSGARPPCPSPAPCRLPAAASPQPPLFPASRRPIAHGWSSYAIEKVLICIWKYRHICRSYSMDRDGDGL